MLTVNAGDCAPEAVDVQLFVRSASTAAAFTVLVWEYLVTWKSEVQYIWRWPFSIGQLIFICARYSGLAIQSHNLFLIVGGPMKHLPIQDASTCVRFILPSLVAARFLLNMLDAILMLELYALYNRRKFVASVLVLLFLGLLTSEIIVGYNNLGRTRYNCICDVVRTHSSVLFFAVTIWIVHLNLGALLVATRRLSKSNRPMIKLVNRDGACVIVLVCVLYAFIVPYALVTGPTRSHLMFGWPISLLSIACCRLIINMQKLHHEQALEQWENQIIASESEPQLSDVRSLEHEDGDEHDTEAQSPSIASMIPSDSEIIHESLSLHSLNLPTLAFPGKPNPQLIQPN